MSRNALFGAAAVAAVAMTMIASAPAAAKAGGPRIGKTPAGPGISVQAEQPRITPKVKIKFNCYYTRQRNELGVWVTRRICG
jgi:hypothetical protein